DKPRKEQEIYDGDRHAHEIEDGIVGHTQIEQDIAATHDQAVIAAIGLERNKEKEEHLCEGERDHNELKTRRTQRQGAEDERAQSADCHRGEQRNQELIGAWNKPEPRIPRYEVLVEDADDISAHTEICGMSEADQSSVTEDQI